jgi:hypothetical protein
MRRRVTRSSPSLVARAATILVLVAATVTGVASPSWAAHDGLASVPSLAEAHPLGVVATIARVGEHDPVLDRALRDRDLGLGAISVALVVGLLARGRATTIGAEDARLGAASPLGGRGPPVARSTAFS